MAFRIVWTETASLDLRGIVEFIAQDNPEAARFLAATVLDKIETASSFPDLGRVVPEKADTDIREVLLAPYRIIYQLDRPRERLHVTRIWHAARGIAEI